MSVDHAKLVPGQEISRRTYSLDAETVSKYVDAVGDLSFATYQDGGLTLVPPMAVAALGLRGVVNDLEIPGGTLHVGQDLEFRGSVRVGDTLESVAVLTQNSVRRGIRFIVVDLNVTDGSGKNIMGGKSTILIPEQ